MQKIVQLQGGVAIAAPVKPGAKPGDAASLRCVGVMLEQLNQVGKASTLGFLLRRCEIVDPGSRRAIGSVR
jgi:hypothetical protein